MAGWWRPRRPRRAAPVAGDRVPPRRTDRRTGRRRRSRQTRRRCRRGANSGRIDPILEGCRDQRWWRGLDDLARDVRYALRTLRHAPVFALVAVLTLTLGIGANAALFQVYEALMLRALPVPDADQLHIIRIRPGTPRNGNFNGRMPHLTSAQVDAAAPDRHRRRWPRRVEHLHASISHRPAKSGWPRSCSSVATTSTC